MNEKELDEVYALLREIEKMQYDGSLPFHKRKMANDADKLLLTQPGYPFIPKEIVSELLRQIRTATEYVELTIPKDRPAVQ